MILPQCRQRGKHRTRLNGARQRLIELGNAEQQRRTAQGAEQRARRGKHMRARCYDTLFKLEAEV